MKLNEVDGNLANFRKGEYYVNRSFASYKRSTLSVFTNESGEMIWEIFKFKEISHWIYFSGDVLK